MTNALSCTAAKWKATNDDDLVLWKIVVIKNSDFLDALTSNAMLLFCVLVLHADFCCCCCFFFVVVVFVLVVVELVRILFISLRTYCLYLPTEPLAQSHTHSPSKHRLNHSKECANKRQHKRRNKKHINQHKRSDKEAQHKVSHVCEPVQVKRDHRIMKVNTANLRSACATPVQLCFNRASSHIPKTRRKHAVQCLCLVWISNRRNQQEIHQILGQRGDNKKKPLIFHRYKNIVTPTLRSRARAIQMPRIL